MIDRLETTKLRVLVVDDSPFIRRIISDWVNADPDLELVGYAINGEDAVEKVLALKPDVVTLDVEMPRRDGLWALKEIMAKQPTPVLMVSSLTREGAEKTLDCLAAGAVDCLAKPTGSSGFAFISSKDDLLAKIHATRQAKLNQATAQAKKSTYKGKSTDKVVLIAASTGGPKALATLWQSLPTPFPAPIVVVQHMPPGFTASFAQRLNSIGTVPCREAAEGDYLVEGQALLAPAGWHLIFGSNGQIRLTTTDAIHGVRPAADHMFQSGAQVFGPKCIGVVLTGMGKDGAEGALSIKNAGGVVLGECEFSCTIYGMPKAAKALGAVESEFPIDQMHHAITSLFGGRYANAS